MKIIVRKIRRGASAGIMVLVPVEGFSRAVRRHPGGLQRTAYS
jgi:hypothetical protein